MHVDEWPCHVTSTNGCQCVVRVCVCAVRAMTHLEDLLSDGAIIGKPHSDTSTNLFMH